MKKLILIFNVLIMAISIQLSFGRQVGGCIVAWNYTPIIYGPCPYYSIVDQCGGALGENICFCECISARTTTVGGILELFKLEEGEVFTIGIDTSDNLVIYNDGNETTSILISAEDLQSNYGVTGDGDSLWLGLTVILNEPGNSLIVYERSEIISYDAEWYLTSEIISNNEHHYDLTNYRLPGNYLSVQINGSINLISNNSVEKINFLYSKNENLNIEIFNSQGQRVIFTPFKNSANYFVGNLPVGVYFVIINNNEDAIIKRKLIIK